MATRKKQDRGVPTVLQIQIQPPNGKPRPLKFSQPILTVGSGSDNDLVLNDAQVQPEHLRLEMLGKEVEVTYLHHSGRHNGDGYDFYDEDGFRVPSASANAPLRKE